jgi:hypothetical protein
VIAQLARGGVDRGVFWLPVAGRDRVESHLQDCLATIEEYRRLGD